MSAVIHEFVIEKVRNGIWVFVCEVVGLSIVTLKAY